MLLSRAHFVGLEAELVYEEEHPGTIISETALSPLPPPKGAPINKFGTIIVNPTPIQDVPSWKLLIGSIKISPSCLWNEFHNQLKYLPKLCFFCTSKKSGRERVSETAAEMY